MVAGDWFSPTERASLDDAIRRAEQLCRAEFSVYVGRADGDPHAFATSLHNTLVAPARSVLIMVDPQAHAVEVVVGGFVRRTLTDAHTDLAVAAMCASFREGDLAGGLRRGIQHLAEHAKPSNTLHRGG